MTGQPNRMPPHSFYFCLVRSFAEMYDPSLSELYSSDSIVAFLLDDKIPRPVPIIPQDNVNHFRFSTRRKFHAVA